MASMSTNLSPKPFKPSQFHYFTPKISAPISLNPTKFQIRVPNPTNFQIKASSDNNRNRAVDALNSGGTKRTVNFNEAQKALLASLNLKISDEGDFVYVYPHDYQSELAIKPVKSIRMKIEPFLEKGKMAAIFLLKLSFGMSLAASSVVVVPLLLFRGHIQDPIMKDRQQFGNGFSYSIFHIKDLLSKKDWFRVDVALDEDNPIYAIDALRMLVYGKSIKYVFPVVFGDGDGDPNQGIEEKMWKMIEQYIAVNGGVVAAEELAPYLDPNTTKNMEDDSYILPVLLRLGGVPEVDDEGYIVYYFPSLQSTAPLPQTSEGKEYVGRWDDCVELEKFLKEKEWKFSDLDDLVIGGVNVILGRTLFWHLSIGLICWLNSIAMSSNPFLRNTYYPLILMYVIYASSFLVIKFFGWVGVDDRNLKIAERNKAREQLVKVLESPNHSLKQKILSAQSMALRKSTGEDRNDPYKDISYEEWDRIFNERWNRSFFQKIFGS